MGWDIAVVSAVLLGYALVSKRLDRTVVTAAMVFLVAGFVLGSEGFDVIESSIGSSSVRHLAEAALALVLFSDASSIDTRRLLREVTIPARLLTLGLPLTIALGSLVAIPLFPELGVFEAIVLAVLLAPTDAALGQAVVSDHRLPSQLRQGLNVESGLNDGVCVPLLVAAVAFAILEEAPSFEGEVLVDLVKELGIAVLVGVAIAAAVAIALRESIRRNWLEGNWMQVVPLATAAASYVVADELGGSGFIACFAAGLLYGRLLEVSAERTVHLDEELGALLSAVTFFMFAAVVMGEAIVDLDVATVVYAVLSLTLVRMLPVAVSLVGGHVSRPTMAFAGWFGPRGLASIVFMLTIVDESSLEGADRIVQVATVTVVLSVFAHGITAHPLTDRYVAWSARNDEPGSTG